jgi:hypothetical protein
MFGMYNRLNLHIADSNIELIRRARRQMHKTARGRKGRIMRHDMYRLLIEEHDRARALFFYVMRG